jgi:hydrogenase maturation protein HypF
VRNDPEGVWIEIEGSRAEVSAFPRALESSLPPRARISEMEIVERPLKGESGFSVASSAVSTHDGAPRAMIPADIATCEACLAELFTPSNRRYRYPFINCTDCGPRHTIVRDLPYDRAKTTMGAFAMCEACRAEYEEPRDRRFHAEPIACPRCGPQVSLRVSGRVVAREDEAVRGCCALLAEGRIIAVKGLGGFQLACDARNDDAVQRLRERKRRPDKPFAVMTSDPQLVAILDSTTLAALKSPAQPIVLAPRSGLGVGPSVGPRLPEIGVMLPTTPLHHLLLAGGPPVLVMTSGNVTDEPIAIDDAAAALAEIADAVLTHDRGIHTRADDSVGRIVLGELQPVRRGRGWAPEPISLGFSVAPVLAVGAEVKNAICVTRGSDAFVSQHIGDLDVPSAHDFFLESIEKLERLLDVRAEAVAYDLHPNYAATRWARASGRRAIPVQHHHAHVASCLVENGVTGPAIGVAFDGTGCGPAGDAWGGEILVFDLNGFTRAFHLRPIALPGGEKAIREPWRLGVAALVDAGLAVDDEKWRPITKLLDKPGLSPRATGAGRWFDAIAALLDVRPAISYEAQAAIELEALADSAVDRPYSFEITDDGEIDLRPVVRALMKERIRPALAAARFHSTLAEAIAACCRLVRARYGIGVVALSGGCFQNRLLTERTVQRLESAGFRPLVHRRVPPNDGGLALGQAAIAARILQSEEERDVSRNTG